MKFDEAQHLDRTYYQSETRSGLDPFSHQREPRFSLEVHCDSDTPYVKLRDLHPSASQTLTIALVDVPVIVATLAYALEVDRQFQEGSL